MRKYPTGLLAIAGALPCLCLSSCSTQRLIGKDHVRRFSRRTMESERTLRIENLGSQIEYGVVK